MKLLVAEDDPNLGIILKEFLIAKGYETTLAHDGDEAYKVFVKNAFDLVILDVMMPKKDGFTLAKEIRKINKDVPLIFLTAKSLQDDRLEGFKSGADDYVTKPFSMEELLMRINAIIKRTHGRLTKTDEPMSIGKYVFDPVHQTLTLNDDAFHLTSKENDLLKLLATNSGEVLERSAALKSVWGDDSYFNSRSMDVYITKLRKYLKGDPSVEIINVHGKGFRMIVE